MAQEHYTSTGDFKKPVASKLVEVQIPGVPPMTVPGDANLLNDMNENKYSSCAMKPNKSKDNPVDKVATDYQYAEYHPTYMKWGDKKTEV